MNFLLTRISRASSFAFSSLRRAPLEAAGVVASLVMTLLFFALFISITLLTDTTLTLLKSKLDLPIEIRSEASADRVQSAIRQLSANSNIKNIRYVSPTENITIFSKKFPDLAASLSSYGFKTPLPAMLYISPTKSAKIETILENFDVKIWDDVLDFSILHYGDMTEPLTQLTQIANSVEIGIVILAIIALIVALLAGFAATRTALLARQKEINLMHITGATPSFIRTPFIIESTILGTIAAVISLAIFGIIASLASPALSVWFTEQPLILESGFLSSFFPFSGASFAGWWLANLPLLSLAFIFIAAGVGIVSAMIAVE